MQTCKRTIHRCNNCNSTMLYARDNAYTSEIKCYWCFHCLLEWHVPVGGVSIKLPVPLSFEMVYQLIHHLDLKCVDQIIKTNLMWKLAVPEKHEQM